MMRAAILASGSGSNFEAIVKAERAGKIKGFKGVLLIVDRKRAYVRVRARKLGIKEIFVDPRKYKTRHEFEKRILALLMHEKIRLVVLAGFMRILSPFFVKKFPKRILNIHPALLPSFKGTDAIKRAYLYGVKVTGVTVHIVDEKVDHGPIILQEPVRINFNESLQRLEKRIHAIEHRLYPKALSLFCRGKVRVKRRF